ncbi:ammonium transporter [Acinetobacter sp. c1-l78]|uniref:ammonium transporter n=1 Tax=Acinetobacter sp. c1-l78 TaxID=3342803 RepID=UPI0035B8AF42
MLWIILVAVAFFVVGSIMGLRVSPREKALGDLRENARKIGLHPRLLPAPEWAKVPMASETRASMIAYYSILVSDGKFALMRATVDGEQRLQVLTGDSKFQGQKVDLKGVYAVDMQANCVGLYWDESADYHGEQLDAMKAFLQSLAEQAR